MQVNAYLDNMIDVATLLEDSDTKTAALEKVADLEEALSHVSEVTRSPASLFPELLWGSPTRHNGMLKAEPQNSWSEGSLTEVS